MDVVDSFNKNTEDDQFENLIMSDMQLQDLEGGICIKPNLRKIYRAATKHRTLAFISFTNIMVLQL